MLTHGGVFANGGLAPISLHKGRFAFMPANADEAKFDVANVVAVYTMYADGWAMGRNEDTGEAGMLPMNFLSPALPTVSVPDRSAATRLTAARDDQSSFVVETAKRRSNALHSSRSAIGTEPFQPRLPPHPSIVVSSLGRDSAVAIDDSMQSGLEMTPTTDDSRSLEYINAALASAVLRAYEGTPLPFPCPPSRPIIPELRYEPPDGVDAEVEAPSSVVHVTEHSLPVIERKDLLDPTDRAIKASLLDTCFTKPPTTAEINLLSRSELIRKMESVRNAVGRRVNIPANMGRLTVMVVGDSGIGKTSLIKKLLTVPEVATVSTALPCFPLPTTTRIMVHRASTVPPSLLRPFEDPDNLTMIDTPGFGATIDALSVITPLVEYQHRIFDAALGLFDDSVNGEILLRLLSDGIPSPPSPSGFVDVCLYGILHRLKPVDLEFLKRLSATCAVVPVILKCDGLTPSDVFGLKSRVLDELVVNDIRVFGFGLSMGELMDMAKFGVSGAPPFAVSTVPRANATGEAENELEVLRDLLMYRHTKELRRIAAEMFLVYRREKIRRRVEETAARVEFGRKRTMLVREAREREREREKVEAEEMMQAEEREREMKMERERDRRQEPAKNAASDFSVEMNRSRSHPPLSIDNSVLRSAPKLKRNIMQRLFHGDKNDMGGGTTTGLSPTAGTGRPPLVRTSFDNVRSLRWHDATGLRANDFGRKMSNGND
ncbi:hypothetical protein HK101_003280 [Irineochytrium annulatum]|nr:hypothetical protein HK101_003280 [Irineochytrium annulatum]